ncbi:MAG: hypothetical protein ACRCU0_06070 [Candidatus Rhabdochlamydia sp.]
MKNKSACWFLSECDMTLFMNAKRDYLHSHFWVSCYARSAKAISVSFPALLLLCQ